MCVQRSLDEMIHCRTVPRKMFVTVDVAVLLDYKNEVGDMCWKLGESPLENCEEQITTMPADVVEDDGDTKYSADITNLPES